MPKASLDPTAIRHELKTCPGGYVELRTLSFHEMEMRKDIAGRMYQEARADTRKGGTEEEKQRAYFESMNVAVTEFEFRNCIVDHNLYVDDAETQLIDFSKPMRTWTLHPKIGEEISLAIEKLTRIEEDDLTPLGMLPSSFSSAEKNESEPSLTTT